METSTDNPTKVIEKIADKITNSRFNEGIVSKSINFDDRPFILSFFRLNIAFNGKDVKKRHGRRKKTSTVMN